jgi:hypothetical protein
LLGRRDTLADRHRKLEQRIRRQISVTDYDSSDPAAGLDSTGVAIAATAARRLGADIRPQLPADMPAEIAAAMEGTDWSEFERQMVRMGSEGRAQYLRAKAQAAMRGQR